MSEKDLGKVLLRGEEQTDLQALTDRVLRRDRRRIWLLGVACVIAWMMVVMLPWATIMPMVARVTVHQESLSGSATATAADQREPLADVIEAVKFGTIATFIGSVASMFVAALSTVLLIIHSRRATLRQVNARLRDISIQIKTLAGAQ